MHTPVRYLNNAADFNAEFGLGGGYSDGSDDPARVPGSGLQQRGGAKGRGKNLFDTPDSGENNENRRNFANVAGPVDTPLRRMVQDNDDEHRPGSIRSVRPFGGRRSTSEGDCDRSVRSNTNPFCRNPSDEDLGNYCNVNSSLVNSGGRARASTADPPSSRMLSTPPSFMRSSSNRSQPSGPRNSTNTLERSQRSQQLDSPENENSVYYSSPSTLFDTSRRYSRGDSNGSMLFSGESPLAPRQRPLSISTNSTTLGVAQQMYPQGLEDDSNVSPSGALARKLKRTCSLTSQTAEQDLALPAPEREGEKTPFLSPEQAEHNRLQHRRRNSSPNSGDVLIDEDDDADVSMSNGTPPRAASTSQSSSPGWAKPLDRPMNNMRDTGALGAAALRSMLPPSTATKTIGSARRFPKGRCGPAHDASITPQKTERMIPPTPCKDDHSPMSCGRQGNVLFGNGLANHHNIGSMARRRRGVMQSQSMDSMDSCASSSKLHSRYKEEFEEKGVLGGGSFGTVYKCKNRLDGCMYAVKVTKQRFKSRANREQVLKEVYALSAICNAEENPHIVRYFSAFIEDGRLFIQTELCDKSLQDMMRSGELKAGPGGLNAATKKLARQILEGLMHLHKHNLVHLDIKPANIFVKNGAFKVGDLGHACLSRMKRGSSINTLTMVNNGGRFARPSRAHSSDSANMHSGSNILGGDTISPVPHSRSPFVFGDGAEVEGLPAPPPLAVNGVPAFATRLSELTPVKPSPGGTPDGSSTPLIMGTPASSASSQNSFSNDINEGDQRYMAPEILAEAYNHLAKADVFSLGASLYEMCLERELPAGGPEWHEIRDGMLDPEALSRVEVSMRDLIRLMLLRDTYRRPSAEALIASGGPGGILRTEWEAKLAREKAAADGYRKELARLKPTTSSSTADFDVNQRYRIRRSNTM